MSGSDVAGLANSNVAEIVAKLETDPKTGLNAGQLQERLSKYGPERIARRKEERAFRFPRVFLGTYTMDDRGCGPHGVDVGDWVDFSIITSLLLFNAFDCRLGSFVHRIEGEEKRCNRSVSVPMFSSWNLGCSAIRKHPDAGRRFHRHDCWHVGAHDCRSPNEFHLTHSAGIRGIHLIQLVNERRT